MTHDEIIKQLESLLSHCKSMVEKDGGFPIWEKDCEALETAIAAMRPSGEPPIDRDKWEPCSGAEIQEVHTGGKPLKQHKLKNIKQHGSKKRKSAVNIWSRYVSRGGMSMERLTDARRSRCIFCEAADEECAFAAGEFSAPCPDYKRYERLAAIEDILGDNYDLDRLKELVEADRDGRCVVLPCKAGDTVKIDARTWGNIWNFETIENGKFLMGEIVAIIKTRKQTLIKIRAKHNVEWKRPTKRYPVSAIGKTVFLTPEAAEAALKGEQDG